ncbi:hypothetical protein EE612_039609, partial [Oryza sativa]
VGTGAAGGEIDRPCKRVSPGPGSPTGSDHSELSHGGCGSGGQVFRPVPHPGGFDAISRGCRAAAAAAGRLRTRGSTTTAHGATSRSSPPPPAPLRYRPRRRRRRQHLRPHTHSTPISSTRCRR